MRAKRSRFRVGAILFAAATFAVVAGLGGRAYQIQTWRSELAQARKAVADGRLSAAREQLTRLVERWTNDGEVPFLLGECELARGRRDEALAALAQIPSASPYFPRAADLRATHLLNSGRYAQAEEALTQARAVAPEAERYPLERTMTRLYRFEGRFDEVRELLRASWGRGPEPAAVLKELWLLDYSSMPIEAWRAALGKAEADDDRVWLGQARHAILTGRFADARALLDRCLKRRPDDLPVWRARLDLALADDDLDGFREASARLAADRWSDADIHGLRAWIARRRRDPQAERLALQALLKDRPADAPTLERLAALALENNAAPEAEDLHRLKARTDIAKDRFRKLILDDGLLLERAGELADLSRTLDRDFDARAWSLLAEASTAAPVSFAASASPTDSIVRQARALSASTGSASSGGDTLAQRLDDVLRGSAANDSESIASKPSGGRGPAPMFVDDAERAGLRFVFDNGQTPEHLLPETMSGGVGLIDYDGDGWLDVYCVQGGPIREAPRSPADMLDRLFRNQGDGTFKDVSDETGVTTLVGSKGYGLGVTVGDYDGDGRPDLFLSRLARYVLLRNNGDGAFEDVTDAAGLAGRRDNPTSAAFADLDNDGDLDLFVCHYMLWDPADPRTCKNEKGEFFYCDPSKVEPAPNRVFRNDGGRYTDVSTAAGFTDAGGRSLGVVAADVDDDGKLDLFVSNDGTANYLYINQGDFRFEESALVSGVAGNAGGGYQAGMGVACGDLDGDGRPELMVTNFYGEGTTLYRNMGGGLFSDASSSSGLGLASRYLLGFGMAMLDVANRGRLDVMVVNGHVNDNRPFYLYAMPARLYENRSTGGPKLVDVSEQAGEPWAALRVGRGLAAGDLDNDGRVDALVLSQNEPLAYFHNTTADPGRFVVVQLEGTRSNREGVGARVTIEAGGRRQTSQRMGGGSYQSACDPRLHFGISAADRVTSIEVRWPTGKTDRWTDLAADSAYLLKEESTAATPLKGWVNKPAKP
ncbi:MAG: FG-GAP-like repeat-containing protein [Paludisphaera borealis]|uniref:FG-GAP-like repeat-containing protein n=1 Tax=Paludisphaera borealis TaxID=1387353 RepID=UPI002848E32F|nr:FG-GAP-like repeat-containing protein [Paludisphaera borealis]MDR3622935.1 FG-GAP-like repeat-containing protein [Paludisphaera borealis]